MARRLNTLNFVYTAVGIAVAAGAGYYAWRALRNRRLQPTTEPASATGQDNLMDIRRATRKAGRAVKDTAKQVGKSLKRGAQDTTEAFQDASSSGEALIEQDSTGYSTSKY
jgi:uncharacterized membrane protein YccC